MAFPWARLKNWVVGETLTYSDLNAEFNNILNNNKPGNLDDYSNTVSQMQITTSPGTVGAESQATSLAGELERIRYLIQQITGGSQWYANPPRSLSAGYQELSFCLPMDGATGERAFADAISRGAIINASSRSSADVASAHFDTAAAKFGNLSYACGTGRVLAYPGKFNSIDQGGFSAWIKNFSPNDYIAFNPLLGIELYLNSSGQLVARVRSPSAASTSAKSYSTVTGATTASGGTTFKHVLMKWALNGVNGSATDAISLKLNGIAEGTQLTSQIIPINHINGGTWFLGCKPQDPTWTNYLSMSVTPDSDGWTKTGTGTTSVSSGVLTMTTTGSNSCIFERTAGTVTGLNLADMTVDFKFRVTAFGSKPANNVAITIRDDSMNRSLILRVNAGSMSIQDGAVDTIEPVFTCGLDAMNWNQIRLTSNGATNPTIKVYVNGVNLGSFNLYEADLTANDTISFGDLSTVANANATVEYEWFAFGPVATAPVSGNVTGGYLDDIAMFREAFSDSSLDTSLATSASRTVLSKDKSNGITLPDSIGGGNVISSGTPISFYFPSDGRSKITIGASDTGVVITSGEFLVGLLVIDDEVNWSSLPSIAELLQAPCPRAFAKASTAAQYFPIHLARTGPFSLGLRKADLYMYQSDLSATLAKCVELGVKQFYAQKDGPQ